MCVEAIEIGIYSANDTKTVVFHKWNVYISSNSSERSATTDGIKANEKAKQERRSKKRREESVSLSLESPLCVCLKRIPLGKRCVRE